MDEAGPTFWDTETLMKASAGFMALLGLAAAFFPGEILEYFGYRPEGLGVVLLKVLGGLYFGFAALNWMGRRKAIGGIYSRPVAVANFIHFLVVALVLLRHLPDATRLAAYAAAGGVNSAFAAAFGWLLYCGRGDTDGPTCG